MLCAVVNIVHCILAVYHLLHGHLDLQRLQQLHILHSHISHLESHKFGIQTVVIVIMQFKTACQKQEMLPFLISKHILLSK